MSFFGFEQNDLEKEKANFLRGRVHEPEDIAVYTWGEESYDGLGDALLEGGDDLNSETFGDAGAVGKDFDFSNAALPDDLGHPTSQSGHLSEFAREPAPSKFGALQGQQQQRSQYQDPKPKSATSSVRSTQNAARSTPPSLEAIWNDTSPFSVLPGRTGSSNGAGRLGTDPSRMGLSTSPRPPSAFNGNHAQSNPTAPSKFSPFDNGHEESLAIHQPLGHGGHGVRTLQEIEAEMRIAAQRQQLQQQKEQQLVRQRQLIEQEQLRIQQQEQEQELLVRQRLQLQQEQQQQLQLQQLQRLQQQQYLQERAHQHQRTPPPRMLPVSQSPRFHDAQQRQLLLLQQQQEQQQQQRLLELQERLRIEDLDRQLRATQISQLNQGPTAHRRTPSGPTIAEYQTAILQQQLQQQQQNYRRQHSQSPALRDVADYGNVPLGQGLNYLPQSIQLQQRLLSELAQAEFLRDMHGGAPVDQEALRTEALRKIVEAEQMEEKRRRKATKIARMSKYNDLMTQSDKDFITRIQVSQLVTQDPYAEDFYAQVYGAILRSKMGLQPHDERVLKFGSGGGVGLGLAQQKGNNRRPNAMQRMEQQVERIVSNARKREEEKGVHSLQSLQGALGKTSGRSYKAAPRQLLQVDSSPTLGNTHAHISKQDSNDHAQQAKRLGQEALGHAADSSGVTRREPLAHREVLSMLEHLYDLVLQAEQLRRDQPLPDEQEELADWEYEYKLVGEHLWEGLKVMVPLETSDPHPFISLLMPVKGKKLLPRLCRHLADEQIYTLLTLLVACFNQLDVVKDAPILDTLEDTPERAEVDRQTQAFLTGGVIQSILPVMSKAPLRIVTGLLGLLLDRTDIAAITQTKPGLALLTLLLSRVEVIKQNTANSLEMLEVEEERPSPEEAHQWTLMFDHLFQLLTPHLLALFSSTRLAPLLPQGTQVGIAMDELDQQTWQFLAALALHASPEQHQVLVASLREKILHNVVSINKGWVTDEEETRLKLANVNIFLNAIGLDSSQITL
ncbi:hypothetical protein CCMSSC00406_0004939 [Pleurotus cornucopiae]|uniref:Uncharacterized protein n=1 Tax=Pleurotus cornucopiae TaxID=5321 RepID=A0ACB7J0B1_PLECO|nr:hypothetical protein CCMSSC00406_0004939 [Pleurotus cornucopiae]